MKRSSTAWADGVRRGAPSMACVNCNRNRATEVIMSGAKWEDDGILETALCDNCLTFFERAYGKLKAKA